MRIRRSLPVLALVLAVTGCSGPSPAPDPVVTSATSAPVTASASPDPGVEACRLVAALTPDAELEPADLGNIARAAAGAADPALAAAGRDLTDALSTVLAADDPRGEPMIALAEARIGVARVCDRIG